jgi:hypothetical protein
MRKLFVFLGVVFMTIGSVASAQEVDRKEILDYIPDVSLDARYGYSHDFGEGLGRFGGNGLFLNLDGKISPRFSYSMNHRIANTEGYDNLGFGNTNWLTLDYEHDYFSITAGKQDIKVGSFEYDAYDLDCYWEMNSSFWNNVSPWQWGLCAGIYPADGHTILLQATNSPFSNPEISNLFAYAAAWQGEWDFYDSYWSVNMWEYQKDEFIKSLNFGNRFYLGDFTIELDYSTRCKALSNAFTEDFTLALTPSYEWEWGRAFAKIGWERISPYTYISPFGETGDDMFIGDNGFYGIGAEFFPLKSYKDIRIHAVWASNTHLTACHYINIGLTWKLNLSEALKRLLNGQKK